MNKSFILAIILLLFVSCSTINIPLCNDGGVNLNFKDTQGVADSTTKANICHDKEFLYVVW